MPQATRARTAPRRRFRRRRVNPAKKVQEWELTRLRKSLKRMMPKPEWKVLDTTQASTIITTTATVTPLTAIAQDTFDFTRIGDKVTLRSLLLRLAITPNDTAGVNFLRVIIFRDKQNNAVAPTATQLLQTPTNYLTPLNDDFGKRFKVHFDRTYTVDTDANGAQVDKLYRKFKFVIEYPGTGTVPNTNGLYMLQLSDQATNGPSVQWFNRIRFTDV